MVFFGYREVFRGFNSPFFRITINIGRNNNIVQTQTWSYDAGYIINSAGLYADAIGKDFGFSQKYSILPFKGLYLYSDEPAGVLKTNIYPVPNLRNPFLGTHFTVTVDGKSKIGPTAIPAFWREHYDGLNGFKLEEFIDILLREKKLIIIVVKIGLKVVTNTPPDPA